MPVSDSSQGSQSKQNVEHFLEKELDSNVFELSIQSFFSAFLPSPRSLSDEDAAVVECLSALTRYPGKAEHSAPTQDVIYDDKAGIKALNIPFHDGAAFSSLKEAQESEIYPKLEAFLNFINSFYRQTLGIDTDGVTEVDKAWPSATQPWTDPTESPPPPNSAPLPDYLHRRFFDIHGSAPLCRYSRDENPKVSPDLALLLGPSEGPEPPERVAWKDIKIPIEAKMCIDTPLVQISQYARCIKLEQFDRKFIFTLTFTQHTCRVARWDPAVCYITEEIQLHQAKPLDFIKLIGRLVCMSPSALGYDEQFSNAGRVLDVQADRKSKTPMRTTLTIISSEIQEGFGNEPPQQARFPRQYLLEDRMLCRAGDGLFCRSTRVWEGRLIEEAGLASGANVIKETWQDEKRTNEAWFYDASRHIENGVARMGLEVLGVWRKDVDSKCAFKCTFKCIKVTPEQFRTLSDRLCHRVLVRIVLRECIMLPLYAALHAIDDAGVLHTSGNILLAPESDARQGNTAFILDSSQALQVNPDAGDLVDKDALLATGTLPYMALEVLQHNVPGHQTKRGIVLPSIHLDLESWFWVLFHVSLAYTRYRESSDGEVLYHFAAAWGRYTLRLLLHHDVDFVTTVKEAVLGRSEGIKLDGQFALSNAFMIHFAKTCRENLGSKQMGRVSATALFDTIAGAAAKELDGFERRL